MSVSEGTNHLFSVDKESLRKLNEMLSSSRYVDMMESCKNFNHVLLNQRKRCVPFIDQHTGLAQNDCNLWKQSRERMPALNLGQIFTYPARRWIKRKRQYLSAPVFFPQNIPPEESVMPVAAVETPTFQESIVEEDTKESWFYEMEKEEDFENSDNSDYDFGDRYRRKKASTPKRSRSSRSGGSRRRPATEADPADDHPKRSRSNRSRQSNSQPVISAPPPPPPVVPTEVESLEAPSRPVPTVSAHSSLVSTFTSTPQKCARKSSMPSLYCDFCLGDVSQNKKTGLAEELISCADCGRSGHPSCLQFTGNMLISVKKYRWQCIECKCCSLCGNSDNDDQLLFCDDCDRGYHMYCLRPPLTEPPEGSWSCSLCMAEFHQPASQ